MQVTPMKFGLLAVIFLQIGVLFYMLRVYNDFVSSPENFYKNILVKEKRAEAAAEENNF